MTAAEKMLVPAGQNLPASRPLIFDLGPAQMIAAASLIATALADIIERQKLYTVIQGKKYVQVEGWTTLGVMLGIVPEEESVKRMKDGSYVAKVILTNVTTGMRVGGASALCSVKEKKWGNTDDFARRSMAVTRATGKAYRLGYSWIMKLAGYEPTPFEEMPENTYADKKAERPQSVHDVATKSLAASVDRNFEERLAPRKAAAPAVEVYDNADAVMQGRLARNLSQRGIDESLWEQIGAALHGLDPGAQLVSVINQVVGNAATA